MSNEASFPQVSQEHFQWQAGREDFLVHPSFVEGKILLSQALNDVEEMEIALRDFF